jgi:formylglycine-generating enzyme required for sulfatase activity
VKVVAQEETSAPISGTHDMILIPAGEFVMGNEGDYADEAPRHTVKLSPYYLDEHEVTNAQFDAFVKATDYVTAAEREGHCWAYLRDETDWQYAADTDWRQPQGPNSTIADMMDHPVVCVSWEDATAYAGWAGKRLPSEAEWEYAARAGSPDHFVARTSGIDHGSAQHASSHPAAVSDRSPSSKSHTANAHQASATSGGNEVTIEANVWEGHWPEYNRLDDGFYFTAPAGSFAANRAGVYDMLGNVWEWTGDWYDSAYYSVSPAGNPQGPSSGDNRVARGGSWFCSPNYCGAYSTHYRGASPPDRAFNNVGFRCAADVTSNSK